MLRPPATWNPKSRHGAIDVIVVIPNRHASRHCRRPFSPACSTTRQRRRLTPRSRPSPRHKQPTDITLSSSSASLRKRTRRPSLPRPTPLPLKEHNDDDDADSDGEGLAASFARAPGTEGRDGALRVLKASRSLDLDCPAEAMSPRARGRMPDLLSFEKE